MANRILRDWTDSDKVNALSVHSERFFTRLIMKADDFGCFHADVRLLKAHLFPLLLDVIREADLLRWMAECQKAGLIVLYESKSKKYLQIVEFGQRLRSMNSKFPLPTTCGQMSATCGEVRPEVETETKQETEDETKGIADKPPLKKFIRPSLDLLNDFFLKNKSDENQAEKFFNYYESKGWLVGKASMKNWEAAARNWISNQKNYANASNSKLIRIGTAGTSDARIAAAKNF